MLKFLTRRGHKKSNMLSRFCLQHSNLTSTTIKNSKNVLSSQSKILSHSQSSTPTPTQKSKPKQKDSIILTPSTLKRNYRAQERDPTLMAQDKFEAPEFPPLQRGPIEVEPATADDVKHWPECKISGINNGLRIATESYPWNTNTVSIGIFIDAGSRYETDENNGSAHFLEHLAFKGTHRRTREKLEMEVEDIGGHLNAYTSREQTVYYAQVMKQDMNQAVDILSDILTNSTMDEGSIERERSVILQEMENVYSETKEELIFDHLHSNCFQDCSLGKTILGPVENIKRISKRNLEEYINTYYTGDNMAVVATGAIDDHQAFCNLIEDKFKSLPHTNKYRPMKDESFFRGCDYEERWDDMEHVNCAIAYETCPWNSSDTYPLMFMQQMLGQWDKKFAGGEYHTSALLRYLFSDPSRPIAENYMAFNTPYTDTGLFGVYGCVHPYDLRFFVDACRREMNRFGYDINESQLEDVRERLKATMLLSLGNTSQSMEIIGRELLVHGRRIHPMEAFTRVNDVDCNAIKLAAHRYLIDKDHTFAAVGPTMEFPIYQYVRWFSSKSY